MYVSWKFPHCPRTTMKLPSWQLPGICTMATWNARPLVNQTIETKKSLIYHDPLGKGVHVLFSGESISDVDHNMIQIYLDTCWSYPKLWNHLSIDHPRWGARHPWQSFGRSLGTVQHHGFGFLQTWHTVVQKMVKRCWKMMRSKWYQI